MDVQERAIRSYCRANHHRLVQICRDDGISGSNGVDSRQGLFDALALIAGGQADGFIVRDLDRLARNLSIQESILARVWKDSGHVYTAVDGEVLEDDPDDPQRTAMRQMRGVFAQLDAGLIRKRLREGRRLKAERGEYAGGAPPLGMKAEGKTLVENNQEQETLDLIKKLADDGLSLRDIATRLNQKGVKTKRGKEWYASSVARALDQIDPKRRQERQATRPNWRRLTR